MFQFIEFWSVLYRSVQAIQHEGLRQETTYSNDFALIGIFDGWALWISPNISYLLSRNVGRQHPSSLKASWDTLCCRTWLAACPKAEKNSDILAWGLYVKVGMLEAPIPSFFGSSMKVMLMPKVRELEGPELPFPGDFRDWPTFLSNEDLRNFIISLGGFWFHFWQLALKM